MEGHASEIRGRTTRRSYARRVMDAVDTVVAVDAAVDGIDAIARDLDDVDAALKRLDAGTYFTDEATGAPLDPAWLAEHPLARRAPGA